MYYVYAHINPATNTPFYIGKGTGERAYSSTGRNKFWNNTVKKYGFGVSILVDGLSEQDAFEIEKQYIKKYGFRSSGGTLVNLTDGGSGGRTIGEHNRASVSEKCRISKLGERNPNYGKKTHSFGKPMPEETKRKLSESRKGYKLKPEHKEKVLAGLKKAKEAQIRNCKRVVCLATGKEWANRTEFVKDTGISLAYFKQMIRLNRKVKNGYYLTYKK